MGYVMVPVPEEHVEEAMRAILRLSLQAKIQDWDQEAITERFLAADEPTRSVLSAVARGSLAKGSVADEAVAESIEMSPREVLGIVREVNEEGQLNERPPMVVVKKETEVLPSGRTREQRKLVMGADVAGFVREAERADAEQAPHPLMSDAG